MGTMWGYEGRYDDEDAPRKSLYRLTVLTKGGERVAGEVDESSKLL